MRLLVTALLVLSACRLPTDPRTNCAEEVGCTETTPRAVSQDAIASAMHRASDRLQADVNAGAVTLRHPVDFQAYPPVEFRACPFMVYGADCSSTGSGCNHRNVCAAGETDSNHIIVSTFEADRTIPLIEWETRNWFLVKGGRSDLAA